MIGPGSTQAGLSVADGRQPGSMARSQEAGRRGSAGGGSQGEAEVREHGSAGEPTAGERRLRKRMALTRKLGRLADLGRQPLRHLVCHQSCALGEERAAVAHVVVLEPALHTHTHESTLRTNAPRQGARVKEWGAGRADSGRHGAANTR